MKRSDDLSGSWYGHACSSNTISELADRTSRQLREFPSGDTVLGMENMVVDMAPVDDKHLPCHSLVTLVSSQTMGEKILADFLCRQLACIGSIDTCLYLAFNVYAECISGLLGGEMSALSSTKAIRTVHEPSRLDLTGICFPTTLTN